MSTFHLVSLTLTCETFDNLMTGSWKLVLHTCLLLRDKIEIAILTSFIVKKVIKITENASGTSYHQFRFLHQTFFAFKKLRHSRNRSNAHSSKQDKRHEDNTRVARHVVLFRKSRVVEYRNFTVLLEEIRLTLWQVIYFKREEKQRWQGLFYVLECGVN